MSNNNDILHYSRMCKDEIDDFVEMFSVFQDLVLSMIRNAVHVLPKDKSESTFKPNISAHMNVNVSTKHNQEYEKFIDIKDVFLSCITNEEAQNILSKAIKCFTVNNNKKIKFCIKSSVFKTFDDVSKLNFSEDIKLFEKIINKINNNFNQLLPEAQQKGRLMISKIRRVEIPDKAKYNGREQTKFKGRSQ